MERPRPSTLSWVALVGGVALYDFLSPEGETMSEAFDRFLEHPKGRYAAFGAVVLTAAHLLNVYEKYGVEHLDPIHQLVRFKDGRAVR